MRMIFPNSRTLKANRLLLAEYSEYFKGSHSFEGNSFTFDSNIVAFSALEILVEFIESGKIEPTMENVEQLIQTADYLQINSALAELASFLHKDLKTPRTVSKPRLLLYLRLYANIRRQEVDPNYIGNLSEGGLGVHNVKSVLGINIRNVLNDITVLELDQFHFEDLLASDSLRLTEADVLGLVKRWIYHDYEKRNQSWEKLLPCVRVDNVLTVCE